MSRSKKPEIKIDSVHFRVQAIDKNVPEVTFSLSHTLGFFICLFVNCCWLVPGPNITGVCRREEVDFQL